MIAQIFDVAILANIPDCSTVHRLDFAPLIMIHMRGIWVGMILNMFAKSLSQQIGSVQRGKGRADKWQTGRRLSKDWNVVS